MNDQTITDCVFSMVVSSLYLWMTYPIYRKRHYELWRELYLSLDYGNNRTVRKNIVF